MHPSALLAGKQFFLTYCPLADITVLDVGSQDVNGSLRAVAPDGCRYTGVDMSPGPGVDVVAVDPYKLPFDDSAFDVVLSTSCFEHDPCFWLAFLECIRVLKRGGYFYLNVPSNGVYHTYPTDNWRFYPDAGLALAYWGRRNELDVHVEESFILNQTDPSWERDPTVLGQIQGSWNDFVCVFRKGQISDRQIDMERMYSSFPGATNVWIRGNDKIMRSELMPENMRKVIGVGQ